MRVTGAAPLRTLEAVALDTETTGLDASKDRIVQIGAVAIRRGAISAGETLETLVDPGAPIPPAASAIHGISDAMVSGAPAFPVAWQAFADFAAGRVVLGHSIGFDFAVIAHEAARVGLAWKKPRSLCVRLLATAANPNLPDYSLDTIASWLGVAIADRHSALADACAAGDVFVALLPRLAKVGIRTLAEAERACLSLNEELRRHQRAGWAEPVSRPDDVRSFVAIDPYAYRHRVSQLMSGPPVIAKGSASLREAMAVMLSRHISSIFVCDDGAAGAPLEAYGIVTERDMVRHLSMDADQAFDTPIEKLASRPLMSVPADAFAYRAIGRMARLRIRHLAVTDGSGRLAGVVSIRDLLQLRAAAAIDLSDSIEAASTAEDMAAAWALLPGVVQSLIAEEVEAPLIAEIITAELRAMTSRAAKLAEAAMIAEGKGPAPCAFSVLVLGSGGRGESLLAADQDNAIVFAEGEPDGPQDKWFAEFGETMNGLLDRSGIPFCKGGVMAKNPAWRGSIETWRQRVSDWIGRSRPQDLLNVDIFFDMRAVYGDQGLAGMLRDHAFESARGRIAFAKALGERAAEPASPFTLLGRLRLEAGRIDLKRYGLFPVVAFARALSIRHDIRSLSTHERLADLASGGIGSGPEFRRLAGAHASMLKYALSQQSRDSLAGIAVSNRVDAGALSGDERAEIKAGLRQIGLVAEMVRSMMFA